MSDLIDREALLKQIEIDAGDEPGVYGDLWNFVDTIKNMPSIKPEQELLNDGTLVVRTDFDMTKFDRVNVIQNGTHYGDLFYQDD